MDINIKQISLLDKIFDQNKRNYTEISCQKVLRGERFSYQLEIKCGENKFASVSVNSTLKECVHIYRERAVCCDMPTAISRNKSAVDDNYLTFQPAMIPDVLEPIENSLGRIRICEHICLLWVRVDIPIPASNAIEPFLKENIKERWVYYCCNQGNGVSNRFIAMSSFRNRIMGIQMYKFNIKGFLQWGYNFYYSEKSEYKINPYVTTSADFAFPSGDAFSVYPGQKGALPSVRAFVFYEALQDFALCKLLEDKTDHGYVIKLIDEIAGKDVRFAEPPEDEAYLFRLRERIISELQVIRNA
ncbi:MAG: DUF4091 domain-containing protein [Clostridiales bacterium]|nr:DUF4091 domain-containing protein [Clostridiales bacterium]